MFLRRAIFLFLPLFATAGHGEGLRVVSDIAPVHALVAQVMGDTGAPALLLPGDADAHSFQMRPSQARMLSQADLVVWVGPALTPWMERALGGLSDDSHLLTLLEVEETRLRTAGTHGEGDEGDDHGHGHMGVDPHAWLSPDNGALWLGAIARALALRDPNNAAAYFENATAAQDALAQTTRAITARLLPARGRPLVTYHDAYGYFTDTFGLTLTDAILETDAAPPGAAHLADLRALARDGQIACVFGESGQDTGLVQMLAEGSPVKTGMLDPVGKDIPPGPGLYTTVLENLASEIAACAAGS